MAGGNNTLTYRVGQLEIKVGKLDESIDELLTNDMPHLKAQVGALETKITVLTGVNIGAIILALIVSRLL